MTALLSFRDGVKDFCSKYDKFVSPLCKFILAIVMFWSIAHLTGYNSMMSSMVVVLAASFVCAFLSDSLTLAIGGVYACAQVASASIELGITFVIIFVIMYCVYIRFFQRRHGSSCLCHFCTSSSSHILCRSLRECLSDLLE